MPPKGKKRKVAVTAEEQQFYDNLEVLMYKYRAEDDDDEAGMFGEETVRVQVDAIAEMCTELDIQWDPAVLAVLEPSQRTVDFSALKLIFKTLQVKKWSKPRAHTHLNYFVGCEGPRGRHSVPLQYLFQPGHWNNYTVFACHCAQALEHPRIVRKAEPFVCLCPPTVILKSCTQ